MPGEFTYRLPLIGLVVRQVVLPRSKLIDTQRSLEGISCIGNLLVVSLGRLSYYLIVISDPAHVIRFFVSNGTNIHPWSVPVVV